MWYTPYEVSVWRRIWKYLLGVVLLLWVIVSFVLGYFYLLATGSQEDKKGGTFVEGIFGEVSYLPYLKSDDQSIFYQKFLFRSCLNLYKSGDGTQGDNGIYEGEKIAYSQDLCKVYTEDNQNYVLRIADENATWSDGTPVTIQDVFYTYDEIIRKNRRNIQSLNAWNSVTVALEDDKVRISFPTKNSDNVNFFVNAILPKHIIDTIDFEEYKNYFSVSPVTNGCAKIMSQTKDVNSLIFDLNGCNDTNFAYYQVKNYETFDNFENSLKGKNEKAMVDAYSSVNSLEGFTGQNVLTSKLLGVFFNTDSGKANIRLRRSLGGLIYHNFFTGGYDKYVKEYDGEFLNYYVSAGENVSEMINRLSLSDDESIDTNDLKDSGAQELPSAISINGVDRKFVFFLEKPQDAKNLEIKFSNEFSNIKVKASSDGSNRGPKNYKTSDKKIVYKLINGQNLKVGVNNFTISGFIKNKTYTIASIDIYVFEKLSNNKSGDMQWKLNVLYYNDLVSEFAIQQMRDIFKNVGILENFVFEPVFNAEELEGKLLMGTYDIYVGTIDIGSRKDVLPLFGTEDPLLNPSRYRNPILNSLITQFYKTRDENVKSQINILLAQDMPVIFLGNTYEPIQIQENIKDLVFPENEDGEKQEVYAYKWRYDVYSRYSIVHSVRLNAEKALDGENFETYLVSNLFPNNEVDLKSVNVNLDFLDRVNKDAGYKMPYYVFDYVSLLNG